MRTDHLPSPLERKSNPSPAADAELLRRFADQGEQDAFTELVQRYINLVYSTALRRLAGDTHLAEDVTQRVFTDAARKAKSLAAHQVLSGWLYTSTCFQASNTVRTEQRRKQREQKAHAMNDLLPSTSSDTSEWTRLRPVLDDALRELKTEDREALLLRFFEGQGFTEIGHRLRLTENAARMRVERALERLRLKLGRYGITSTAAALSGTLAAQAMTTAPAGLAGAVTAGAIASVGSGGTLALLPWLALNKVAVVSTAALLSAAAVGVRLEERQQSALKSEYVERNRALEKTGPLQREIAELTRSAQEVAELRRDDDALDRLKQDAAALRLRLRETQNPIAQTVPAHTPPKKALLAASGPYDPTQLHQKPQILKQPAPQYPFDLRKAGLSGRATVKFVVTPEGTVTQLTAVDATHKMFETAALEAVKLWRFTPGIKNGKPVSTTMVVPMVFQMNSDDLNWF